MKTDHQPASSASAPRPGLTRSGPSAPPRAHRWPQLRRRSLWVAAAGWALANGWVALAGGDTLPFHWPARAGRSLNDHLLEVNLALLEVLVLMGVVHLLTRRRKPPDIAARAPERARALRETLLLLGYGILGLTGGYLLAKAFGWHPFGLHLAGTIFGTHAHLETGEVLVWSGYNLLVYAILPLAWFRRRYTARDLGLCSEDRRNDLLVIAVILLLETVLQLLALEPETFALPPRQLLLGATLTFLLYLGGAVLPAMIFIYAILVPRYLKLTGSTTSTVILGGLTYAGLHIWDAWTVFTSPHATALSLTFLLFTYLGPGMIKTFLTLRTGNAWVHVWAYHAFAPHTLVDTPHLVDVLRIRL